MVKGIFVVLSGVADEPCQTLSGSTPLQVAKTPNLDELSKKSKIDYCHPVKDGIIADSSGALVSLFGENPNLASRAVLEAMGSGISVKRGDLVLRTNFATIDDLENKNILDRRAGRTLTGKETKILGKELNQKIKLPFKFEFYPGLHHRGILVFRGGFSDNITNADPFYGDGISHPHKDNLKLKFSEPMDEEEDSKLAANLVNNFIRQSHSLLDKHYLNSNRARKGLFSANCLLCRAAGNEPIKFKKLKGKWMALGYTPLEKGVAQAFKMDLYNVKYPPVRNMDVYSNLYGALNKAAKSAVKMIKRNRKKYDYFYVHFKELDVPGRDNKPLDKVKMIELLDRKFFGFLKNFANKRNVKVVVTSDHVVSSRMKNAISGSVPLLSFNPSEKDEKEKRFTEEQALKGRRFSGKKLLERTLFSK